MWHDLWQESDTENPYSDGLTRNHAKKIEFGRQLHTEHTLDAVNILLETVSEAMMPLQSGTPRNAEEWIIRAPRASEWLPGDKVHDVAMWGPCDARTETDEGNPTPF